MMSNGVGRRVLPQSNRINKCNCSYVINENIGSMIFYYSATGNTRFAAEYLAEKLGTEAINILEVSEISRYGNSIGLMFPIYCWGVPKIVTGFIERYFTDLPADIYCWAVCTCGDEAGVAMKRLDRNVKRVSGRNIDAIWSVIMPNTYVLLPGFDVDSSAVEKRKLTEAPVRLDEIALKIRERATGIYDVSQGSFPAMRSAIYPLFEKWGVSTKRWHVSDYCISCGRCEKICPAKNISLSHGRPSWGNNCFSCCACFHCCPVKAISYSSFTKGKSQYLCPLRLPID